MASRWKLKKQLAAGFGLVPDRHYFPGHMEYIRAYFDYRREAALDPFVLDEITWNDLDLDAVFRRVNACLSTSGEQYLYSMLRSPAVNRESYDRRWDMIHLMEEKPALRLELQVELAKLGCTRRADLCRAFCPESHGVGWLLLSLLLSLLLPASVVFAAITPQVGLLAVIGACTVNGLVHEMRKRQVQKDFDTVNYIVSMIGTLRRIQKRKDRDLDEKLRPAYESLARLQSVLRVGGVSAVSDNNGLGDLVTTVFLLDLIVYEFLKNKFGRCHGDIFTIHEALGQVDAAIAIASYRKSVERYTEPALEFGATPVSVAAEGVVHPLLERPVSNPWKTERPMLLTGSNASGKSTYLKSAALAAVMAQSICTCLAERYTASAFRIYSSMALRDDLLAGESYYIVETRSLKRILDRADGGSPVLCVIDEVLRGTNTVERIAASCEILRTFAARGVLCLAATHDVELCSLLERDYDQYHFQETVTEDAVEFDYRLYPGRAASRNAINLLHFLGFPDEIVDKAHQRANGYLETGRWG